MQAFTGALRGIGLLPQKKKMNPFPAVNDSSSSNRPLLSSDRSATRHSIDNSALRPTTSPFIAPPSTAMTSLASTFSRIIEKFSQPLLNGLVRVRPNSEVTAHMDGRDAIVNLPIQQDVIVPDFGKVYRHGNGEMTITFITGQGKIDLDYPKDVVLRFGVKSPSYECTARIGDQNNPTYYVHQKETEAFIWKNPHFQQVPRSRRAPSIIIESPAVSQRALPTEHNSTNSHSTSSTSTFRASSHTIDGTRITSPTPNSRRRRHTLANTNIEDAIQEEGGGDTTPRAPARSYTSSTTPTPSHYQRHNDRIAPHFIAPMSNSNDLAVPSLHPSELPQDYQSVFSGRLYYSSASSSTATVMSPHSSDLQSTLSPTVMSPPSSVASSMNAAAYHGAKTLSKCYGILRKMQENGDQRLGHYSALLYRIQNRQDSTTLDQLYGMLTQMYPEPRPVGQAETNLMLMPRLF